MSIPTTKHNNLTIIVNWKERGFGCAKACSYCNWRGSPLLPQGAQAAADVKAFIRQIAAQMNAGIDGGAAWHWELVDGKPGTWRAVDVERAMFRCYSRHGGDFPKIGMCSD